MASDLKVAIVSVSFADRKRARKPENIDETQERRRAAGLVIGGGKEAFCGRFAALRDIDGNGLVLTGGNN